VIKSYFHNGLLKKILLESIMTIVQDSTSLKCRGAHFSMADGIIGFQSNRGVEFFLAHCKYVSLLI